MIAQKTNNIKLQTSFFSFLFQPLYDTVFLTLYNILFTSLPIIIYGLFEQNHAAQTLLDYPQLYSNNRRNVLMSWSSFFQWMIFGESWKEWITVLKTVIMLVSSRLIFSLNPDKNNVIVFTLCQKNKPLFTSACVDRCQSTWNHSVATPTVLGDTLQVFMVTSIGWQGYSFNHSFCSLSYARSVASSKVSSPHSAI
jgi:magnesium-transporting ATPase (P-type)